MQLLNLTVISLKTQAILDVLALFCVWTVDVWVSTVSNSNAALQIVKPANGDPIFYSLFILPV